MQEALRAFRSGCATALFSVYLPFPILLSQVVTILCYSYILLAVLAQQDTGKDTEPSFHFPFFTLLDVVVCEWQPYAIWMCRQREGGETKRKEKR